MNNYGKNNTNNFCDGYLLKGELVQYSNNYVEYMYNNCIKLFLVIATYFNYDIMAVEETNDCAYALS